MPQGLFAAGPGAALIELLCIAVPGSICASLMAKYEERLMMAVTAVLGGGLLAKGFDLVRPLSSHDMMMRQSSACKTELGRMAELGGPRRDSSLLLLCSALMRTVF